MNIAMMTNTYAPFVGGVPVSVQRLAGGLRDAGHSVTIFAPGKPESSDGAADIVRCGTGLRAGPFVAPSLFCRAPYHEFRKRPFDIIHVHHPMLMGNVAWLLSRLHGLPLVFTWHTLYWHYLHYLPSMRRLERLAASGRFRPARAMAARLHDWLRHKGVPGYLYWFAGQCDRVFTPSSSLNDEVIKKLGAAKVETLPTGIPDFFFKNGAETSRREKRAKGLTFCTVSRLAREKNIGFLLRAVSEFRKRYREDFTFLVIGDGPERQSLEEQAAKLKLESCVLFLGNIANDELAEYYSSVSMFLFASKTETQGIVMLEAMASSTPVVAVDAPGVRDVVRDGYNGRLTAESVEEFAGALLDLALDQSFRERASDRARQRARQFSMSEIAARAEEVYSEAIARKRVELGDDSQTVYILPEAAGSDRPH